LTAHYSLERHSSFDKDVKKLSPDVRRRLANPLRKLAENPRGAGCEPLRGHRDWKMRFARHYRVIYEVDDEATRVRLLDRSHIELIE
jgi:mRNA interferase RelE/StbE